MPSTGRRKQDHTATLTEHGKCGKKWRQQGNRTGHCSGCHETFEGITLFDAHFDRSGDKLACRDPREMKHKGEPLEFDATHGDGTWRIPRSLWDSSVFERRNA